MNKQELIDKAVHELKGEFKPQGRNVVIGGDILALVANNGTANTVCNKQQFQQRARELGYGVEAAKPEGWYDYTNQKALRLPPVGVECEMLTGGEWKLITMIGVDGEFAVVKYFDDNTYNGHSVHPKFYRPLDHETRKAEAERKRVVDAVFEFTYDEDKDYPTWNELAALYDAGFLRMPEDK